MPASPDLKFRGLPDSLAQKHLKASECCLIHMDNKLSAEKGVYVNPNVRVAYNADAYKAVHPENEYWPTRWQRLVGIWKNRCLRWTRWPNKYLKRRVVEGRIGNWIAEPPGENRQRNSEVGQLCIVE